MSRMLNKVTTGKQAAPLRELVYGIEGVGKTSFGAGAPKPVFLGEDGTKQLDVARFPVVRSWEDVTQAIDELRREKHDYETLVVDTLDFLEPVLWKHVAECGGQASIEDVGGGFGKGYTKALESWNRFALSLEELQLARNMHVILLAHAQTKKHKDPIEPEYDRFALRINEKAAALFRGWANSVLFAAYRTTVSKAGRGKVGLVRAATFERILFTQRIPAADAKNRYDLKPEMEFSFRAFWQAVHRPDGERAADKREEAQRLLELVRSETSRAKAQKALEAAGDNLETLRSVISKLIATLEAQDGSNEQAATASPGTVSGSGKCEPAPVAAAPQLPDVPAGRVDSPPAEPERKPVPAVTPVTSVKPGEVRAPAGASAPPPASLAEKMGMPPEHELAPDPEAEEAPERTNVAPMPSGKVTARELAAYLGKAGQNQTALLDDMVALLADPRNGKASRTDAFANLLAIEWGFPRVEKLWRRVGGSVGLTKGKKTCLPVPGTSFSDFVYSELRSISFAADSDAGRELAACAAAEKATAPTPVEVLGAAPSGF